ncbi:MAG TPA: hypothetical protein VFB34_06545 [Chloroflexota bacterium]|nr:hypothetical protein [Chloroflexota bacterium]
MVVLDAPLSSTSLCRQSSAALVWFHGSKGGITIYTLTFRGFVLLKVPQAS